MRALMMLVLLASVACAPPVERATRPPPAIAPGQVVSVVHGAFGCRFELSLYGIAESDAQRIAADAVAEIDRVEDALGGWRDDTALARLNREAATAPVAAPPLLFDTLVAALELTRATGGAFDVTVGPLVEAWGFRSGVVHRPSPDETARLRACVGPEHLLLDADRRTIAFDREGVCIDLDGLNKGVAVDRVLALLRAAGITDASLSAGGSTIGSIGPPPPLPARLVAIEGPDGAVHARIALRDAVLSTSGNWRRTVDIDGRPFGPIFDPRKGEPVEGEIVSATAIARRGDESEALAKAVIVLGAEGARQLGRGRPELGFALLLSGPTVSDQLRVELSGAATAAP